jgi:hypothetical protein
MADTGGNGPQRPSQNRLAAGANNPMAKTIALVVLAVIVGIVLINIVGDDGSTAKTSSSTTTIATSSSSTPTTSTGTNKSTTTTTKKSSAIVPPSQLPLIVVNAGGPNGSAGNVSSALKTHGYTHQETATSVTWKQTGLIVRCKPGFERERTALINALSVPNYHAKAAVWKVQPGIPATVDCYVSIGAPAA